LVRLVTDLGKTRPPHQTGYSQKIDDPIAFINSTKLLYQFVQDVVSFHLATENPSTLTLTQQAHS
jgi:hypothetical protein